MRWKKLGLIYTHPAEKQDGFVGAMLPTPVLTSPDIIRVFYSARDAEGRSRPFSIEVRADDPSKIATPATSPLLEPGLPGTFDDNGVACCSVLRVNGLWYMYYVGFELCKKIRFRAFSGLAVSDDGIIFRRCFNVPVLDRGDTEYCFRGSPFVRNEEGKFKLWYSCGSKWVKLADGKSGPVFEIRYAESDDGVKWPNEGKLVMPLEKDDEQGFGRPWVVKTGQGYELFYSIRRKSLMAYRLGYAVSRDGIAWERRDDELNLDVTPGAFDGEAIMYMAVITACGKTYCFYNGNEFGRDGIALAVLEDRVL